MSIRAQWVISEAGFASLASAGISSGWLRAWVRSAGASLVSIRMLESYSWRQEKAEWRIFFATEKELVEAAMAIGLSLDRQELSEPAHARHVHHFLLHNPPRICWSYQSGSNKFIFITPGDIAYQRNSYLNILQNEGEQLPLALFADDRGEFVLESGLTASIGFEGSSALNHCGLLPEEQLISELKRIGVKLRTVESCTAGAIAARICRAPGASEVFERGWVTYSNSAKEDEVAVSSELINKHGAVSREVVEAMAIGASGGVYAAVSTSGIAGPAGGSRDKPVGTVWIAVALPGRQVESRLHQLQGGRSDIQLQAVNGALAMLINSLKAL